MTILGIIAATLGIISSIAYLPQIHKIIKRKSAEDISLITYGMFTLSIFVWFLYGIELKKFVIIIPNIFAFICCISTFLLSIYYQKKNH